MGCSKRKRLCKERTGRTGLGSRWQEMACFLIPVLPPRRFTTLNSCLTIRSCLRMLYDSGMLQDRTQDSGAKEGGEEGLPAPPDANTAAPADGPEGPATESPGVPPPPHWPSLKITMESAYGALLESLLPPEQTSGPGMLQVSKPATPSMILQPPLEPTTMRPGSASAMSTGGMSMVPKADEEPIDIW